MAIYPLCKHILFIILLWQVIKTAIFLWEHRKYRPKKRRKNKKRRASYTNEFKGYPKKPECVWCEAEEETQEVRRTPPPVIENKRGRPPSVDTDSHYCPEENCTYYGWVGRGNLRSNGHPNGGKSRQLHCKVCLSYFQETIGTIFYRSKTPMSIILLAIAALAEGVGIRSVSRIFHVDVNTVLRWLRQAAQHMEILNDYYLHDLRIAQIQLDELWAVLREVRDGQLSDDELAARFERSHRWVWAAIDPVSKLLLSVVVADHSLQSAQLLVHRVANTLARGEVPLFVTDGLNHYLKAIVTHFGHLTEVEGRRKPRWMPLPQLLYAQVIKKRRARRIVTFFGKVSLGSKKAVRLALEPFGWKINTSFVERVNRTLRKHVSALARRAECTATTPQGLQQQISLATGYYNFCRTHHSLREPLPAPVPTKGNGSPKKWQQRTPAMAAGLTDHPWSLEEVLLFRIPPFRQEVTM